ncbi:uncharacterized protein ACIQIH_004018 [Cyanocitta cristata]
MLGKVHHAVVYVVNITVLKSFWIHHFNSRKLEWTNKHNPQNLRAIIPCLPNLLLLTKMTVANCGGTTFSGPLFSLCQSKEMQTSLPSRLGGVALKELIPQLLKCKTCGKREEAVL